MKDHVCLGAVMGSYGVRGECRVKSFCSGPSSVVYIALKSPKLTVIRPIKGGYAVRLSGVSQKEAADALKGQRLWAHRDALPELPDDEYYYSDLIGLTAFDTGGVEMGKIHAVHDHGAGDLLELRPKGGATVLLPFTRAVAPTVDLASGRIVLDPPKGLMPGDDEDADSDTTD